MRPFGAAREEVGGIREGAQAQAATIPAAARAARHGSAGVKHGDNSGNDS